MTKIAIAGVSGFLGSHIAEKLASHNLHTVIGLVRASSKKDNITSKNIEFRTVDYSPQSSLKDQLDDIDIIINCIAMLGDYDHIPKSQHYAVDTGTLETLLTNVNKQTLQQFIHISTTGIYGGKSTDNPVKEDAPFGKNVSKYEWGKIEAEKVVRKYRIEHNLPITVARPGPVFGPRMIYGWPNLVKRLKSGTFRMIGKGDSCFHVTYVDDIVNGIIQMIGNEKTFDEDFNVCGNEIPTIKKYFSQISSELNGPIIKSIPYLPILTLSHILQLVPKALKPGDISLLSPGRVRFFGEHRIFDNSKLKSFTGFQPKIKLEDGIKQTISWYRENGYL